MKKIHLLSVLILLSVLFSCNSSEKETSSKEPDSIATMAASKDTSISYESEENSHNTEGYKRILAGADYFFSNDTLCQNLNIKEIAKNYELKIPEKIAFKLVLSDKLSKNSDKIFEGVARLASSEESFNDNIDKDGGAYIAADYILKTESHSIQIRLDIENYEACVVSIRTQADDILGEYSKYLKAFPAEGVMKKGHCD